MGKNHPPANITREAFAARLEENLVPWTCRPTNPLPATAKAKGHTMSTFKVGDKVRWRHPHLGWVNATITEHIKDDVYDVTASRPPLTARTTAKRLEKRKTTP